MTNVKRKNIEILYENFLVEGVQTLLKFICKKIKNKTNTKNIYIKPIICFRRRTDSLLYIGKYSHFSNKKTHEPIILVLFALNIF